MSDGRRLQQAKWRYHVVTYRLHRGEMAAGGLCPDYLEEPLQPRMASLQSLSDPHFGTNTPTSSNCVDCSSVDILFTTLWA